MADGNARLAERLYAERYPLKRQTHELYCTVFSSLYNHVRDTGKVVKNRLGTGREQVGNSSGTGRPRSVRTIPVGLKETVLQHIGESPSTSTMATAQCMNTN